jgi:hypothetical protein
MDLKGTGYEDMDYIILTEEKWLIALAKPTKNIQISQNACNFLTT